MQRHTCWIQCLRPNVAGTSSFITWARPRAAGGQSVFVAFVEQDQRSRKIVTRCIAIGEGKNPPVGVGTSNHSQNRKATQYCSHLSLLVADRDEHIGEDVSIVTLRCVAIVASLSPVPVVCCDVVGVGAAGTATSGPGKVLDARLTFSDLVVAHCNPSRQRR